MELLRFTGLECQYGARMVFAGISGVLNEGERIALVGPNGAGKSSLLRFLANVEPVQAGTVARAKDVRLAYLAQSLSDETDATLQTLVERALATASDAEWGLQNKALRTMLAAFGFAPADYARPLTEFSGGQRSKAALAHILIDNPDYLILDEPTNHLDIATVRWLESFIAADKRAYIIVSHDRYFIDRVATRVWEIEGGRLHAYNRGHPAYTSYVSQRQLRLEAADRAYRQFTAEREKRRATIADLRATRTSSDYSQVRSREKQLARYEATREVPVPQSQGNRMNVRLQASRRASTGFAFEVLALRKKYERTLFSHLDLNVQQGERLAIVGPNGAGKSTLLRIIAGNLEPDGGAVRYNPATRMAYYAQNAHDQLDARRSAVDAVLGTAAATPEEARALLGQMRISGDAADKPVGDFSGGERRRIMLACLMARKADVLLLDEPTNDLDIESREALESVLEEYQGALVLVSHDRYLLARLSDRVLWIDEGMCEIFAGGYNAYESLQRKRQDAGPQKVRQNAQRTKSSRRTPLKIRSQLESQITRIEGEIGKLDQRKAEIEAAFLQPDSYGDRPRLHVLQQELAEINALSERTVESWGTLLKQLEQLA
ncbi:MAG: ABC-F family ATP-binding cassette domain-containing protein [Candidatus Eremiobacteraeota bacterium]|nr:ABC-F family ATP-binding cassette domain-containing protein [Candidatus Eremiobacteraeota bacterium]